MRKTTKKTTKKVVKKTVKKATKPRSVVMVARLGNDPIAITVSGTSTVGLVLRKAEVILGGSEHVWVNGRTAGISKKVSSGDIITIVSPRQAGA